MADKWHKPIKDGLTPLRLAATLIALALLAVLLAAYYPKLSEFRHIGLANLLVLYLLSTISLILIGLRLKYTLDALGSRVGTAEAMGMMTTNTLGNYILPLKGGMGLMAVYLKIKHDFPYKRSMNLIITLQLLDFFFFSLMGAMLLAASEQNPNPASLTVYAAMIIIFAAFLTLAHYLGRTKIKYVSTFFAGVSGAFSDKKYLKRIVLIETAYSVITLCKAYLEFNYMWYPINLGDVSVLLIVPTMISYISLIPGGLAVNEVVFGTFTELLGVGFQKGIFVAVLERVLMTSNMVIIAIIIAVYFMHKKHKESGQK